MGFFITGFILSAIMVSALAKHPHQYKRDIQSSEYTYNIQGGRTCYCQCPCDGADSVDVRRIKRASKYDKPAENLCYCQCSCDKVDAGLVSSYIIEDVEQSDVNGTSSGSESGSGLTLLPITLAPIPTTPAQDAGPPIQNNMNQDNILYLDISAKGNEVWAVFCNNTVVRAQLSPSGEFQSWKAVPLKGLPATQKVIGVGASPDGYSYAITDAYDYNIYRYNPDTGAWISNPNTADQISSCGKDCMIGINRNDDGVWALAWVIVALGHKGNWAAIAQDKTRWVVDTRGRLKRCVDTTGWCANLVWEIMCTKSATTVEAQSKDRAVMTTKTGEMFLWNGKNWNVVPVNGKVTRAAVTDNWVFFLNQKGNAFYANI